MSLVPSSDKLQPAYEPCIKVVLGRTQSLAFALETKTVVRRRRTAVALVVYGVRSVGIPGMCSYSTCRKHQSNRSFYFPVSSRCVQGPRQPPGTPRSTLVARAPNDTTTLCACASRLSRSPKKTDHQRCVGHISTFVVRMRTGDSWHIQLCTRSTNALPPRTPVTPPC